MPPRPSKLIPSNHGERTVLTYRKVQFIGDWEYFGNEYAFRPVGPRAELMVVTEGATGVLETHVFIVRRRPNPAPGAIQTTDGVIVPPTENIVYVPERCVEKRPGDLTSCRG
jgi:hypothetical protein